MSKTNQTIGWFLSLIITLGVVSAPEAMAHCQVPCGIYGDRARVDGMLEDASTVAKAMAMITELSEKSDAGSKNQLTRWVVNKETHAQNIIATISDYFLTQRVKSSQEDYVDRLKKHHAVIAAAVKVKRSTDAADAEALKKSIEALGELYPE